LTQGADPAGARPFGLWTATALVIGGMIGAGIFVMPAQLATYGWTGAVAWAFAVGGALLLAWLLSALSAARPGASGILAIVAEGLGPLPGVLIGWSYWVSVWSANAIIALTAVRYLAPFLPPSLTTPLATALSSCALLWLMMGLNLAGARAAGQFQVLTTLLKLLPLAAVILIIAGLALAGDLPTYPVAPLRPGLLTPAVTLAFVALVGFEAASLAAARVRDPARNILRATMIGTALTGLIYIIVCTGIVLAIPPATLATASAPVALFVEQYWGRGAGLLVSAFVAVSAIGALNCWVLMQGEVPLSMARAGVLPRWFAVVNSRDVAVRPLVIAGLLASALILSNASRSTEGLLDFMLKLTTAASLWVYAGACISALVLRVAPAVAVVGLGFSVWALWGSGLDVIGLSFGLMLTAAPLYWLRSGRLAEQPAQ
jgi:APA family basic amino acid/polyamine antiporter